MHLHLLMRNFTAQTAMQSSRLSHQRTLQHLSCYILQFLRSILQGRAQRPDTPP